MIELGDVIIPKEHVQPNWFVFCAGTDNFDEQHMLSKPFPSAGSADVCQSQSGHFVFYCKEYAESSSVIQSSNQR
jgi:hypothetical protein